MSASFPLRASRSHCICFVAAQSRWMTTASWADASHLQQPRPVNNPRSPELFIKSADTIFLNPKNSISSVTLGKFHFSSNAEQP